MRIDIRLTARAERDLRGLSAGLRRRAADVLRRLEVADPTLQRKKLQGRPETRVKLAELRVFYTQEGSVIVVRRFADRRDAYR